MRSSFSLNFNKLKAPAIRASINLITCNIIVKVKVIFIIPRILIYILGTYFQTYTLYQNSQNRLLLTELFQYLLLKTKNKEYLVSLLLLPDTLFLYNYLLKFVVFRKDLFHNSMS